MYILTLGLLSLVKIRFLDVNITPNTAVMLLIGMCPCVCIYSSAINYLQCEFEDISINISILKSLIVIV